MAQDRKGMLMYMPRDYLLRSINGYAIEFEANKPVIVPHRAVDEAIAIGAVMANPEQQKTLVTDPKVLKEAPMGFEREQMMFTAMTGMAEANDTESFTPGGKPKLEAVKDIVGFDVDRKEVNAVWDKVMQARANAA
jgi:hypothetical protein